MLLTVLLWFLVGVAGLFFLTVVWTLFAAITVWVDTEKSIYLLRVWGLTSVRLLPAKPYWKARIRIIFFPLTITLKPRPKSEAPNLKKKTESSGEIWFIKKMQKKRPTLAGIRRKVGAFYRAFKIQFLILELDTDDYIVNAYLFPLFRILSGSRIRLSVNYHQHLRFAFKGQTRLFRLLLAIFA